MAAKRTGAIPKGSSQVSALRSLSTNRDGFAIFSLDASTVAARPNEGLALRFGRRPDLIFPISATLGEGGSQYISYTLPSQACEELEAVPGSWLDDGLEPDDVWAVPGTFPDLGDLEFGDDRCGRLVPSDRTVRIVKQQQLVRTARDAITCLSLGEDRCGGCGGLVEQGKGPEDGIILQAGEVIDYEIRCARLGYTFGDLLYSLPLAPCESVTLAVSHWEQRQRARAEQQSESRERRTATYERENALAEAMNGASETSHRGWAVGGTLAGGLKGALSKATAALQLSFGGTMSSSNDRARIASNATRSFSDRIESTAEAWRQDHQVMILEQTETENQNVSYRTVCNNNHCHVLNIFYHEVLANYRLGTKMVGHREVYLVPYKVKSFDLHLAVCARPFLLPFLLEPELAECYTKLKLKPPSTGTASDPAGHDPPQTESGPAFNQFKIDLSTTRYENASPTPRLDLVVDLTSNAIQEIQVPKSDTWQSNGYYSYIVETPNYAFKDIKATGIKVSNALPPGVSSGLLVISSYKISGRTKPTGPWILLGQGLETYTTGHGMTSVTPALHLKSASPSEQSSTGQPAPSPAPAVTPPSPADADCTERLLAHLNCHKTYYNSLLWLLEDPNERFCRFDRIRCGETNLADLVLLEPLGVMGCHVAFAKANTDYEPYEGQPLVDERLLTLPTPGIFADAALGQCQACETIDRDVYWDWKDSPCVCGAKSVTLKSPESSSLLSSNPFPGVATGVWATGITPPSGGDAGANSLVSAFGSALGQAMLSGKNSTTELTALQDLLNKLNAVLKDLLPDKKADPKPKDPG